MRDHGDSDVAYVDYELHYLVRLDLGDDDVVHVGNEYNVIWSREAS